MDQAQQSPISTAAACNDAAIVKKASCANCLVVGTLGFIWEQTKQLRLLFTVTLVLEQDKTKQETALGIKGRMNVINNTKLVLDEHE